LMASAGDAFTIAEPTLTCKNGGNAKFLAGGEIPIVVQTPFGPEIEYKPYGIQLNMQPVTDENGNISANMLAEVSRLDYSNAVN
ncbi:MAG: type II and iii secretion system protein, partial [Aliifodinibius sp.]|nr:type II and iii secretion system protein [Fodinibius sp.]